MYDPQRHHRRSIRLKGYDYTQSGMYFVTICTHQRGCTFGTVNGNAVQLNDYGRAVLQEWFRTAELRPYVCLGAYVVMPNHFHGIVGIVDDDASTMRRGEAPDGRRGEASPRPNDDDDMPRGAPPKSLGAIVGAQIRRAPPYQRNTWYARCAGVATELLRTYRA